MIVATKNRKALRKVLLIIAVAFTVLTFTTALFGCNSDNELSDEVIRIHIRANSNLAVDQSVKLEVRDSVTEFLSEELEGVKTKSEAYLKLKELSDEMTEIADATLKENGFDYKSNVYIGKETFPERQYGEYTFPAGEYDSVILNLGSGEGDNWWCVAFPPLCFSPSGNVVYKSWIKELLDKIFSR